MAMDDLVLDGTWRVSEDGDGDSGTVTLSGAGIGLSGTWAGAASVQTGCGLTTFRRVAFVRGPRPCSPAVAERTEDTAKPDPSLVVYSFWGDQLAARWSTTADRYGMGFAKRTSRESDSFLGTWDIVYSSPSLSGTVVFPAIELTIDGEPERLSLSWRVPGDEAVAHGVGSIVDGELIAAWGHPDYDWELVLLHPSGPKLEGEVLSTVGSTPPSTISLEKIE